MNGKLLKQILVGLIVTTFLLGVTLAFAEDQPAKPAEAKKPVHVGSKACKTCHMGEKNGKIFEIWEASAHAKAFARLDSAKGETKDAKCLACHTTGYGAGGYGTEGMEAKDLANVGCEACHGPGSEYKAMQVMKNKEAAVAAGLWIPDAKTCAKCHNENSTKFDPNKPFKYEEMVAKIAHKIPPKAEGGK